ncbi:ABC transporter permease [Calidifontibacter sp. DB0510]|uniref:ABC transporter permease n=1 Tax=Metallococcus carri TaxID=1656884 RepID=A0A967EBX2_9MICO|nr:ABC transporter permease [Metallococcus carri]NHN57424.1 ABC transporter permease [Metallococcus carri]NOP39180.1 ABC transporter permease [Calidifontibacter sp. DB2511S]
MSAYDLDRRAAGGGLNPTLLRIELLRVLRNKRTMIFTVVMPVAFFFLFGTNSAYANEVVGNGNVAGVIMTSMALYGAMIATAATGSTVSVERAQGWSRQLRLTPLRGSAYIVVKVAVALAIGLIPVLAVYACGAARGAHMSTAAWIVSAVIVWLGSSLFAAFGLFVGYLLPSENAMQVIGPAMALLAFGGGLFMPIPDHGFFHWFSTFTPMWGVSGLAHAPQTGWSNWWQWVANLVVWLAIFVGGAVWRFRADTARV